MISDSTLTNLLPDFLGDGAAGLASNPFIAPVVLGWVLSVSAYLLRNVPKNIYALMIRYLTTEVTLTSAQASFHDMMKWLENDGYAARFRRVQIRNGRYGDDRTNKSVGSGSHWMWYPRSLPWYKRIPIYIFVERMDANATDKEKERLSLRTWGRSHIRIDELLANSVRVREDANMTKISKWHDWWRHSGRQPKRDLASVVIPDSDRQMLIKRLDDFQKSEDWYVANGIPWHLGIMLYGPPGTGKTSLIKAIAAHCNRSISIIPAHRIASIDDALNGLDRETIAVIEDIDTAYEVQAREIEQQKMMSTPKDLKASPPSDGSAPMEEPESAEDMVEAIRRFWDSTGLSLILNSLDGIDSAHGRILIMTTNHIDKIDKALLRPGRIDLMLKVNYMDTECFSMMLKRFFPDNELPANFRIANDVMPASVQEDILRHTEFDVIVEKYRRKA